MCVFLLANPKPHVEDMPKVFKKRQTYKGVCVCVSKHDLEMCWHMPIHCFCWAPAEKCEVEDTVWAACSKTRFTPRVTLDNSRKKNNKILIVFPNVCKCSFGVFAKPEWWLCNMFVSSKLKTQLMLMLYWCWCSLSSFSLVLWRIKTWCMFRGEIFSGMN